MGTRPLQGRTQFCPSHRQDTNIEAVVVLSQQLHISSGTMLGMKALTFLQTESQRERKKEMQAVVVGFFLRLNVNQS